MKVSITLTDCCCLLRHVDTRLFNPQEYNKLLFFSHEL